MQRYKYNDMQAKAPETNDSTVVDFKADLVQPSSKQNSAEDDIEKRYTPELKEQLGAARQDSLLLYTEFAARSAADLKAFVRAVSALGADSLSELSPDATAHANTSNNKLDTTQDAINLILDGAAHRSGMPNARRLMTQEIAFFSVLDPKRELPEPCRQQLHKSVHKSRWNAHVAADYSAENHHKYILGHMIVFKMHLNKGNMSQAERLGRSCLSIVCPALSLARSAQAERDNESCFFSEEYIKKCDRIIKTCGISCETNPRIVSWRRQAADEINRVREDMLHARKVYRDLIIHQKRRFNNLRRIAGASIRSAVEDFKYIHHDVTASRISRPAACVVRVVLVHTIIRYGLPPLRNMLTL
ncbi:hypothetical protein EVAR_55684_1 [Eumeta japonica]|uniref:Uncharacterized protein n=1 Tax=Eumeta variegata TaxID=151549 RepID=A0A4C1ZAX1_EUMVA|nr:hypothetical protein EVAR_55684_1 [Eumeta japonica]